MSGFCHSLALVTQVFDEATCQQCDGTYVKDLHVSAFKINTIYVSDAFVFLVFLFVFQIDADICRSE